MKKIFALSLAILALFIGQNAVAAQFFGGPNPSFTSGQTFNENVYAGGGNVNMAGAVNGDLFAAGGTVVSSGNIANDLNAAGGTVVVSGNVGDDLRVTGGNLTVNAKVGGEALIAGGQIVMDSSATVNKNLMAAGEDLILNGTVNGNIVLYGTRIELRGVVNGNAKIEAQELVLGPQTVIKGTLVYSARNEAQVPSGAQIGDIQFTEKIQKTQTKAAIFGISGFFFGLISSIIVALILYFIFPKGSTALIVGSLTNFWTKVLIGFAVLILLPAAGIIVALTILGIPFSLLAALLYFIFIGLSILGSGAAFGTWIFSLRKRGAPDRFNVSWITIVIGIILLALINVVPYVGWLVGFAFFLAVFGELWRLLFGGMKRVR